MAKPAAKKKTAAKSPARRTVAKPAAKKVVPGKDRPVKYEDKSPGQPQLQPIFNELKKLIAPYGKGAIVIRDEKPGQYHLWSDRVGEMRGRKTPDMYFSGLMVQKGYVGFYFTPVFVNPELKSELHPGLVKCLKGKGCFHIRKNDPALMEQVKHALQVGYEEFKKRGWV